MIENKWYNNDQTIILQTLSGNWAWDEIIDSNKTDIPNLMNSVPHDVHIIVSLEDSPNLPSGSALLKGRDAATSLPDNLGLLLIVAPSKFVRVLVDMVSSIAIINGEHKMKSATTLEEAESIILAYEQEIA